ncbi:MAG: ImmA/IrrE family metallo-endopeptidase [Eubacteriales bacterium]|jgi:Zn-dependent peptidase ImmA (M78 family)|nr:ImmA/IrrE family metallo-endopeptidase [Eubacteriales bacterium]
MSTEYIVRKSNALVKRCGTRDPYKIADITGINILFVDYFKKNGLKGFYRMTLGERFIFINDYLPERMKSIVCMHEIGHDLLHRKEITGGGIAEFELYNMNSRREFEANVAAAAISLPDDEILEHIKNGYDTEQIARIMNSDINLVSIKTNQLLSEGHKFNRADYKSNFLK